MDTGSWISVASLVTQFLIVIAGVIYTFGGDKRSAQATEKQIETIEQALAKRFDKFEATVFTKLDKLDNRINDLAAGMHKEIDTVRSKIHKILNLYTRLEARVDLIERQLGVPALRESRPFTDGDEQ